MPRPISPSPGSLTSARDLAEALSPLAPAPAPPGGPAPFHIDRNGDWFYHGSPITRKAMIALFATVLRRGTDGGYRLQTPIETVAITVEDAPFVVVALEATECGRAQTIDLITNLERRVPLGPAHRLRTVPEPGGGVRPYVDLGAGLEARLLRPVFYELVDRGMVDVQGDTHLYGIWSRGMFFALGPAEEDEH